eukprot:881468-Amphidinium_carterae.1
MLRCYGIGRWVVAVQEFADAVQRAASSQGKVHCNPAHAAWRNCDKPLEEKRSVCITRMSQHKKRAGV